MSTLSLPQLSLNLPSSRVSVDFATFAVDLSALSTSSQEGALNFSSTNNHFHFYAKLSSIARTLSSPHFQDLKKRRNPQPHLHRDNPIGNAGTLSQSPRNLPSRLRLHSPGPTLVLLLPQRHRLTYLRSSLGPDLLQQDVRHLLYHMDHRKI